MTERQRRLVRDSYDAVQELSGPLAMLFYGRLFELDPSVRPLFKTDLREQGRKLMATLDALVTGLEQFDRLRPLLHELGRKHVAYGARPAHYLTLRAALIWALARALDEEFDRETKDAWAAVIEAVAQEMLVGAESVSSE
jgi:hemoglobin-like flavoprotein